MLRFRGIRKPSMSYEERSAGRSTAVTHFIEISFRREGEYIILNTSRTEHTRAPENPETAARRETTTPSQYFLCTMYYVGTILQDDQPTFRLNVRQSRGLTCELLNCHTQTHGRVFWTGGGGGRRTIRLGQQTHRGNNRYWAPATYLLTSSIVDGISPAALESTLTPAVLLTARTKAEAAIAP